MSLPLQFGFLDYGKVNVSAGAISIKLFTAVICKIFVISSSVRPFQAFSALPVNIRLGWKGLPGTNTGSLRKSVNYGRKKFYRIGSLV